MKFPQNLCKIPTNKKIKSSESYKMNKYLLTINYSGDKLVSEKEYALLEQIQNDPELTQKLLSQYGI